MLILGDWSSGFGLRKWKWPRRVAEVVRASRGGAGDGGGEGGGGGGGGTVVPIGDAGYTRLFRPQL